MTLKQRIKKEIDALGEDQLRQVSDFVAFVRHRKRLSFSPDLTDAQIAQRYAMFAEEDRLLAEEGMADYAKGLAAEDRR